MTYLYKQIQAMLKRGYKERDIADVLGCSVTHVNLTKNRGPEKMSEVATAMCMARWHTGNVELAKQEGREAYAAARRRGASCKEATKAYNVTYNLVRRQTGCPLAASAAYKKATKVRV